MKNWKRKMLAGLMAVVLIFSVARTALAAENKAAQCRNGVVRVLVMMDATLIDVANKKVVNEVKDYAYATGSAFGVGKAGKETDVFVTNRHVIEQDIEYVEDDDGKTYAVQYTPSGYYILLDDYAYNSKSNKLDQSRTVPFTVIYKGSADDDDVAILRAANPISGRVALPLLGDEKKLQVGDTVTALGFPGSSDGATTDSGYLLATAEDVTLTNGVVSRFFDSVSVTTQSPLSGHLIQSTASINGGNSGGPLIDENGTVVGINTYTYHGGSDKVTNAYYALRIQYVKEALEKLDIQYDTDKGSGNVLWIVALSVVALLIVAVAVVLVKNKTKKPEPQPVIPDGAKPVPPSNPNDSGYRVQGVSGALEGKRYMITRNGTLTLGRDPQRCNVVLPNNTPGVSGCHCSVWLDGDKVMLKDEGSTHGTFLNPGRRLAGGQAVQLLPGEVFSLGSQEQSFVIAERR